MNNEMWMARAKSIIESEIPCGVKFEVKQLFPGHEWEALSRGERTGFGRYFASCVHDGELANITQCENGKSRHNRYIKLSTEGPT